MNSSFCSSIFPVPYNYLVGINVEFQSCKKEKNRLSILSSIEKAIIVGLVNQKQDSLQTQEFLDELAFLALTSGAKVLNRFTQRLNQPLPNTFIGKGKLDLAILILVYLLRVQSFYFRF